MSIIMTKKQCREILEFLDNEEDDTEIKIREQEICVIPGVFVSVLEYPEDGETFIKKAV